MYSFKVFPGLRPVCSTGYYAATAVFYGAAYTERHFWPKPHKAFIVILQEAIVNLIGLKTPRVRFSSEYYRAGEYLFSVLTRIF